MNINIVKGLIKVPFSKDSLNGFPHAKKPEAQDGFCFFSSGFTYRLVNSIKVFTIKSTIMLAYLSEPYYTSPF